MEFAGRGDMSRGGLMLRCVLAGVELDYAPIAGATRHGERPPKLEPVRGILRGAPEGAPYGRTAGRQGAENSEPAVGRPFKGVTRTEPGVGRRVKGAKKTR